MDQKLVVSVVKMNYYISENNLFYVSFIVRLYKITNNTALSNVWRYPKKVTRCLTK